MTGTALPLPPRADAPEPPPGGAPAGGAEPDGRPAGTGAPPRPAAPLPSARRARRRLSRAALLLYVLSLALLLGLGSAYWSISAPQPMIGGVQVGPWKTWPRIGARDADPYSRAVVARTGGIPLGAGEGLAFVAEADSAGRPLDAACAYRVGSVTPQTRHWTLTVYTPDGRPAVSELERAGFTSEEVLREPDGRFNLVLSREASPGNWLRLPASGRFTLVLRLYDTPVAVGTAALETRTVPAIEMLECPR